jgi:hypothetical protein
MPQVKTFRAPTAYEEEMLKAQRQRQLAEMLQQQAFAPEAEPYTFQGFRAQPSAANAIARVLSAYTAKKVGEKAETAERAAREADVAGAEQVMRGLAPQARVAAPTAAEIAGSVGMPQISEEGTVSYGPTVQPQMRTEMVGPTAQERRDLLTQTMVRGTPMAQRYAQLMLSREPQVSVEALMEASPESRKKYQETGDYTVLEKPLKAAEFPSDVQSYQFYVQQELNSGRTPKTFEEYKVSQRPTTNIQMPPTARDLQKDESGLRDQLQSRLKEMDWAGTQSAMQRIVTAPNTPIGDVDIVYAVAKAADSSGAVRKEDFDLRAKEGSYGGQIKSWYEEAKSGRMLPERRRQLIDSAMQFYQAREANVNKLLTDYTGIAQRSGLNVENVIGPFKPMPLWSQEDENELQRLRAEAAKSGGKKP